MDGCVDGWMDRLIDRQTDRQIELKDWHTAEDIINALFAFNFKNC